MARRFLKEWLLANARLAFPFLYLAAYFALLKPDQMDLWSFGSDFHAWIRVPNYRSHEPLVERMFLKNVWNKR